MFEIINIFAIIMENIFPIALAFFLIRKMKSSWKVVAVGAIAFVVSQIIHIPILQGLEPAWSSKQFLDMPPMVRNLIYAVTLGLLAGICEEPMRWLSFKLLREKGDEVQTGVLLGVGHGGIESILVIGYVTLVNMIILVSLKNGWLTEYPGVTPDMITQYFSSPWHLPLVGVVERLSAISLHIGLSVMVWKSIKYRSWKWFIGAILFHTFFDFVAVMTVKLDLYIWVIEAIIFLISLTILIWTIKTVKKEWALQMEHEPVLDEISDI